MPTRPPPSHLGLHITISIKLCFPSLGPRTSVQDNCEAFFEEFCKIRLLGVMTFDQKVLTLLINTLVRDISPMKVILFAVNFQKVASRQLHKS